MSPMFASYMMWVGGEEAEGGAEQSVGELLIHGPSRHIATLLLTTIPDSQLKIRRQARFSPNVMPHHRLT